MSKKFIYAIVLIIFIFCLPLLILKIWHNQKLSDNQGQVIYTYVAKLKGNYYGLVHVGYSNGQITWMPSLKDQNDLVKLNNGYVTGLINSNTAFLNITYSEYNKLKEFPDFKNIILDDHPFTKFYRCEYNSDVNVLTKYHLLGIFCKKIY